MTVLSVLGRRRLPSGMDSVALPFAGLFALPSVRSVMPGNPPFGQLGPTTLHYSLAYLIFSGCLIGRPTHVVLQV